MKKYLLFLIAVVGSLVLTACVDYGDATETTSLKVHLVAPEGLKGSLNTSNREVKLVLGGQTVSATTNADGVAEFTGIVPDVYNISVSWTVSNAEYTALTGLTNATRGATVTGTLNGQLVGSDAADNELALPTHLSVNGDIVIGKIYSSGSRYVTSNKTYQAGKYVELFNQSDDTVDVAGLYIGLLESGNPQAFTLDNLKAQFNDSVLIAKQIFRIPAGKPFKVVPGGTVLLVNSAVDHSAVSGFEHDLSGADFEAKTSASSTSSQYQTNPNVPALDYVSATSEGTSVMNLVQGGPCGMVLFRTTETHFKTTYGYGKKNGALYLMIPTRYVIDAVDFLKFYASGGVRPSTKRVPQSLDAGYVHISNAAGWNGDVVYRKTARVTPEGRIVLQDTNNSINDFQISNTILPRQYDK